MSTPHHAPAHSPDPGRTEADRSGADTAPHRTGGIAPPERAAAGPAFYTVQDAYEPRSSIGFLMRSVIKANKSARDARLSGHGFTDEHWVPIFKMHRDGPCDLAMLTAELGLDPQAMRATLADLQSRGVVDACGIDGNGSYRLSAQGTHLGEVVQQVLVDIANDSLRGFSPQEFHTLLGLLQRVHDNTLARPAR